MTVDRSTDTKISSGSSDCDAKALTVMPCIRRAAVVVMIVTPVAKCPMAWRKDALSGGLTTPIRYGNVSRRKPGSAILQDIRLLQSEIHEILHSVRIRDPRHGAPGTRLRARPHLAGGARRTGGPAVLLPGADRRPASPRRTGDQPDGRQGRLCACPPARRDLDGRHRSQSRGLARPGELPGRGRWARRVHACRYALLRACLLGTAAGNDHLDPRIGYGGRPDEGGPAGMIEARALNVEKVREDFPTLARRIHGRPLVYLDSAATSQKPAAVIDAMDDYYRRYNANPHRGVYAISEEATAAYESARQRVATFINAASPKEVIFTRNTTEAITLVRYSWGRANVRAGDRILLTEMEHHSNLVPWQLLAKEVGATLEFLYIDDQGLLQLNELEHRLQGIRLLAITHQSNTLGTINPIKAIVEAAHRAGALVLIDGAQAVPHMPVDVRGLGVDFYAFSGHKMCGPTGIGVLWARRALLEAMPPFLGGGDMIKRVSLNEASWNDLPWKFEAGTPSVAEGIGLGAAVDYLSGFGMDAVRAHERTLIDYAMERLQDIPGITLYGPRDPELHGGAVSFTLPNIHPHDLATLVDREGIAVRAGHHCTQPLMDRLGVPATTRASFYIYNRADEVDQLVNGIQKAQKVFA